MEKGTMATVSFSCEAPVIGAYDVCIVGGGPAGMAAAVTCAVQGLKVFLGEAHSCFGGMGTAGMVPAFMQISNGVDSLIPGYGEYLIDRLRKAKAIGVINPQSLSIRAEVLKRVYDSLVEETRIRARLLTTLIGVQKKADGTLAQAIFHCKSGIFAVEADYFIDATGDGDLSAMSGADYEKGDEQGKCMPSTLCSLWSYVDFRQFRETGKPVQFFLEQAFKDGIFRVNDPHHSGMWEVGPGIGGGNIGHVFDMDPLDADSLTVGLIEGRKQMPEFERFYRDYVPGFKNCQLMGTGSLMGVRESRRIMGEYVLTLDDFVKRASFPDEIGRYSYPVDIHPDPRYFDRFVKNMTTYRMKVGESYGIPLRILLPRKTRNLLCAGRCVSTDRYVQSSLRVMPGCFITGQGAGVAAATAIQEKISLREISPELLKRKMAGVISRFRDMQQKKVAE